VNSLNATDRLRRLLAVIPWVVDKGGASLSEISSHFDYPTEQLVTDLEEVLFMVGVHPFTPECLVDVFISDGFVEISYADWFRKPLHLSQEEMFRLIVAGKSVSEYLDTDELGSLEKGLMKLAAASGTTVGDAVEVNLGMQDRGVLEIFKEAKRENRRLKIKYYSYGRNEENSREIDIYRLFADKGHWYAEAYCHRAEESRIFRLDRVGQVESTDQFYIYDEELLHSGCKTVQCSLLDELDLNEKCGALLLCDNRLLRTSVPYLRKADRCQFLLNFLHSCHMSSTGSSTVYFPAEPL